MNSDFLYLIIFLGSALILGFFNRRYRRQKNCIENPKLGFCNLIGKNCSHLVDKDKKALIPLFSLNIEQEDVIPQCDVLMLYCEIQSNGLIAGSSSSLREIIRESGALVVVVASENENNSYLAATRQRSFGTANLVLTIARNGQFFPEFFHSLFYKMMRGKSMLQAWVELAPQIPGLEREDLPDTIFLPERGQVQFKLKG